MIGRFSIGFMVCALLSTANIAPAEAQTINLRNANFMLVSQDLRLQKPGLSLDITRTYNSRSLREGLFGFGWSTRFDTKLYIHADGSLLVEDGDGFRIRYTEGGRPWAEIRADFVGRLIDARKKDDKNRGVERNQEFYEELAVLWKNNADEREQATWLWDDAWVSPPDGEYISYDRGTEKLEKRFDGFIRHRANGMIDKFDLRGRLVKAIDRAGRGAELVYDRDGRLVRISHTDGANFTVQTDDKRRITTIRDTAGRTIKYTYSKVGDLVQVNGPDKRAMAYAYDEKHNLTAARESGGETVQVIYDTEKDWAVALKRGEDVVQYRWVVEDGKGERFSTYGKHPDGTETQHQFDQTKHVEVERTASGEETRTLYSACCNKPLEVQHPDGTVTRYDYDPQARLIGLEQPNGTVVRYQYAPDAPLIVSASFSDGRRYQYSYDKSGRLKTVESSKSGQVTLVYGRNGKVAEINADRRQYALEYDLEGRPTVITAKSGAALRLRYGNGGQVLNSQFAAPSGQDSDVFHKELSEVLDMLLPANGSL